MKRSCLSVTGMLLTVAAAWVITSCTVCDAAVREMKFTHRQLQALVRSHIEEGMPWAKDSMRLEFQSYDDDVVVKGERITHQIFDIRNDGYIGDARFGVKFFDRGEFIRETSVNVRIEVLRNVVVASRVIDRNVPIGENDVHLEQKWVKRMSPNISGDIKEVIGKRLTVSAVPNREIQVNYLKPAIVIKRGAPVRIVYDSGALYISSTGYAEEDGVSGGMVRIRNVSSPRSFYARVINDSQVAVEF